MRQGRIRFLIPATLFLIAAMTDSSTLQTVSAWAGLITLVLLVADMFFEIITSPLWFQFTNLPLKPDMKGRRKNCRWRKTIYIGEETELYLTALSWKRKIVVDKEPDRINLRLLKRDKNEGILRSALKDEVELKGVIPYDSDFTRREKQEGFRWYNTAEDAEGGISIYYLEPYAKGRKRRFWFTVKLIAHKKWKGKISLQGPNDAPKNHRLRIRAIQRPTL